MSESLAAPAVPERWHGLWRSIGYNKLLEIGPAGYALDTATAHHATPFERGPAAELAQAFDRVELMPDGRLALFHAHDLTRYEFERCERWPADCRRYLTPCADPLLNFAAFCEVFAENYAFFELRGVDWAALSELGHARLTRSPSAATLLDTLGDLVAALDDLHVHVTTPDRRLRSALTARGPREALQATFCLAGTQLSLRSSVTRIAASLRETLLGEFASTLRGFRQAGNDVVAWGTLRPGVGYLNLLRMFGFASTAASRQADDLPHRLSSVGPFMAADMAALNAALDEVIRDLAGHRVLIVDVRLNGGGFDRAGMLLCERLVDRPTTVYLKKARTASGFTPPQSIVLTPSAGPRFGGSVLLLTSALTVSAGEVLALAMTALPNVTLLGERTQGILSDNLFHRLPNGWEVSLSNEVYMTRDGRCFEAEGVPPAVELPPLGATDLLSDLRAGLRLAVQHTITR